MPDTWPGLGGLRRPARTAWGTTCATCSSLFEEFGYDGAALYGHFGQGCVHTRIPFDLITADGIAHVPLASSSAPRTWSSPTAGRCPASTATDRPAASCCRPCSALTSSRAFREFKTDLRPRRPDEPRQGRRPEPARPGHCASARDWTPRRLSTRLRLSRTTTAASTARSPAASASATAATTTAASCARPTGSPGRRSTPPAAAPACCSRCSAATTTHPSPDGWRSTEVRDALDLCLSCKGCKNDCPVGVDMATYKAEFLHHHYARPAAPARPLLDGLAAAGRPGCRTDASSSERAHAARPAWTGWSKRAGGIDRRRDIPLFAEQTLQAWFATPHRARHRDGDVARWCCGPTRSPTTSTPPSARPPSTC